MFLGIWYLLIRNTINNYDVISLLKSISLYRLASLSTNTFYVCGFIFRIKKMSHKLVYYGTQVMNWQNCMFKRSNFWLVCRLQQCALFLFLEILCEAL